jgi:hypothetical protein
MALRRLGCAMLYWYSSMIDRTDPMISVIATPRGHRLTHILHVVHSHHASSSISANPNLAWQIIWWGKKLLTLFQGQLTVQSPH